MTGPHLHRPEKSLPIFGADYGLFKVGASRFDLRDPYHLAVSLPGPIFALALLGIWLAINVVFAAVYSLLPGGVSNAVPGSFTDAFFFSIETLATVGYGVMAPVTLPAHIISATEIVIGMAFTAIVTGLLFVRFSRPRARIMYAENPVVTTFSDHRTLMIRLANSRMTVMTNANVKVFALIGEHTPTGKYGRRLYNLPLQQAHLPVFVMPWTLMHDIDESSPLFPIAGDQVSKSDLRIVVALESFDHALNATVYDMKLYQAASIRFGMRYAESVSIDAQGRATADLARISLLEPDSVGEPEWAQWVR